jgi:hypothetical protein
MIKLNRILFLASILLCVLCFAGCGSFDSLCLTMLAVLGSISVALTAAAVLLTPAEEAAGQAAIALAEDGVNIVKSTYDAYEKDKTNTGLLATFEAALAALKANIAGILTAIAIKNTQLQTLITTLVNLLANLIPSAASAVKSYLVDAVIADAGDTGPAKALDNKLKALAQKLRYDHDAAVDASGVDPALIAQIHKTFNDRMARHVGPFRV